MSARHSGGGRYKHSLNVFHGLAAVLSLVEAETVNTFSQTRGPLDGLVGMEYVFDWLVEFVCVCVCVCVCDSVLL